MSTVQITDDDIGKAVVNAEGDNVGIVSAVRYGTAYVDPDPGIKTRLTAALGWDDIDDEDGYPLQERAIATITDDQIRLRSDL
ncbi:PRC-barrel domain containing protein [Salinigranum marinum]|uniref:PRC-barrel domain containing protein n=1 Tax=Salinigranum marinum TaxID=1515595 RepID=UPI002989CF7E|nr:PRC-barrel domain containing protein [Salinigranum marinum]